MKEKGKSKKGQKENNKYTFYAPPDTEEILRMYIVLKQDENNWWYESKDFVKNPNLLFGRFIPVRDKKEDKDKYLSLVIREVSKLLNLVKSLKERHESILKSVGDMGFHTNATKPVRAILSWRMVVGLGASHPQETSMTLHHIYGIPYIPGSAVKGVTRHWLIESKFGGNEEEALKNEDFKKIFGTQEQAGEVIFFDAYPEGEIHLKIDVMNPHYPNYYSGSAPPADWQNPVPIKFLTVENTKFIFLLASKDKDSLGKAEEYLKKALQNHGIGAKTSLGYGLFKIDQG